MRKYIATCKGKLTKHGKSLTNLVYSGIYSMIIIRTDETYLRHFVCKFIIVYIAYTYDINLLQRQMY